MKKNNQKQILITGGAGFLGSNLARKLLLDSDNHVIIVDNFYSGKKSNIEELLTNPNFSLIEHDIINPLVYPDTLDEIYHLGCPASPPFYQKEPIFTTKTCFLGTLNMLELAKNKGAKILFSSTSEVYGEPLEHPQKESYRGNVNPNGIRSCYDEGKRVAESLLFDYFRQYDLSIKVIRIFNTYGPFMRADDGRVISNFIMQALNNQDITIYGVGEQTRSFCYVDDLIRGMLLMMATPNSFTGPVNLGNTGEFTVRELAETIIELTKSKSKLIYQGLPADDPSRRRPDISLAEKSLNWFPTTNLREGLQETINFFQKSI